MFQLMFAVTLLSSLSRESNANDEIICPVNCFCRGTDIICGSLKKFPTSFPKQASDITIYSSTFDSIPTDAFANLQDINQILIYEVTIGRISCSAFRDLEGMTSLTIYNAVIGSIEPGAFMNIDNVKSIAIYSSTITDIKEMAFSDISEVSSFTMFESNITTIHQHAFHNFQNIEYFILYKLQVSIIQSLAFEQLDQVSFSLYSSSVDEIATPMILESNEISVNLYSLELGEVGSAEGNGLFYNTTNIKTMSVYLSKIKIHHCGLFEDYGNDERPEVSYYNNKIWCDCNNSWIMKARLSKWGNKCYGPYQNDGKAIKNITVNDFCPDSSTIPGECPVPKTMYKPGKLTACGTPSVNAATTSVVRDGWIKELMMIVVLVISKTIKYG